MIFKLIPWGSLRLVAIVTITASIAISSTGLYMVSMYRTLTSSLMINDGDAVITSSTSKLPHTGLVRYATTRIANVEGIELVSPEVITPVVLNGEVVFLRGVNLSLFNKLADATLVGDMTRGDNEVLVGIRLSNYLRIHVGDSYVITAIPTGKEVKVFVSGVFRSNTSLDDEVVGDLRVVQELRGVSPDYVTLVRIRAGGLIDTLLHNITSRSELDIMPLKVISRFGGNRSDVELVDELLGRGIKISSNLLWTSLILVLTASSLAMYYSVLWSLSSLKPIINSLKFLGLSSRVLTSVLAVKSLTLGITAGVLGYLISYLTLNLIFNITAVRLLLHSVELVNDFKVLTSSALLPSTIILLTILVKSKAIAEG